MKVFVTGSRWVEELPPEGIKRLQNIVDKNLEIVIGDRIGVEQLSQQFFQVQGYKNVTVYYQKVYEQPLFNCGNFTTIGCSGDLGDRDEKLCNDAEYLLAIWNENSPGTRRNIERFTKARKKKVVIKVPYIFTNNTPNVF